MTTWVVRWRLQGTKHEAELPSEFEARSFAQICVLLSDVTDVELEPGMVAERIAA